MGCAQVCPLYLCNPVSHWAPFTFHNDSCRSHLSGEATKRPRYEECLKTSHNDFGRIQFTPSELQRSLFHQIKTGEVRHEQKTNPQSVTQQHNDCFCCDPRLCPLHSQNSSTIRQGSDLPMALSSLPPEVGLCVSSTVVVGYGICAKREIPRGAWIGPYEGKFVKPKELYPVTDTTYMWEIYNGDELEGFIDGSDETASSWMRYIRCARHIQEQNLFAFQYLGKVYYRSFKPILPGQELLVWYDEKYPQYFGIPTATFDLGTVIKSGASAHPDELVVVSPHETDHQQLRIKNHSSFFPSPPPSPLSLSTSPSRISHRPIDVEHPLPRATKDNIRIIAPDAEHIGPTRDTNIKVDDSQSFMTSLNRHEGAPASLWTCGQRDSSFLQKNMLQIHRCIQASKKPYRCGRCSESFPNPTQLNTHAVTHGNSKPFKCGFCSRSFTGTTTLNNHIRKHTGKALSYRV